MKNEFPNHYINPKDKGEDWIKQMVKAIWEEFDNQSIKSFRKGAERYQINRLYAIGKNSNDKYKPMFEVSDDVNSSYINLDLTPPAILPKFKRLINNKHSKISFVINAQAIDEKALEDKLSYEATEAANIKVRKMLQELGLPDDVLSTGEMDQPMEDEELAIKMEFGYKHNMAIDVEKKVDAVFTESRLKDSLTIIRDRLFDSGVAILKAFTNPDNGRVGFRVVDPDNWVVSPTKDPFFRDIWYAGESILMTVDEIRRECRATGVDISEQQLEEIATKNLGKFGNSKHFTSGSIGSYAYDSTKIPVFDGEFLSVNKHWFEKRWDKRGNPVIGKVEGPSERKDREYYSDEDVMVYRCKWIIDTEIIFNYGMKSDVYRKDDCLWDTRLSYIAVAPELNEMETNPMIEQMIPIVDQIIIAWYKLQNVIAKARPRGIQIEIGALEDITLGDAGSGQMTPLSVLDMYTQTGVLVYRKVDAAGNASNFKPIEELDNGLGNEASEYFAVIDRYMGMLSGIIGMNDITDGSTADPKLLNGVAGMMQEATSNSLHHLLIAERYLVEMLADEVAVRVHDSMTFKKKSVYRNIVASSGLKSAKEDTGAMHRIYGMAIEYDADQQEKQSLKEKVNLAIQTGQITLADSIVIERVRNLKQAEQLLAYRIDKNQKKQAEMKRMEQMTNAEASALAAKAAEEEKRKTFETEMMMKLKLLEAETQSKMMLLSHEYALKSGIEEGVNQTKKEVEQKRSETQEKTAAIKAQNKSVPEIA